MSFSDKLMAGAYPAVVIEQWTGVSGWPCFRIHLMTAPSDEPVWDGQEYETLAHATKAAETFGASMLPAGFQIVVMPKDNHG